MTSVNGRAGTPERLFQAGYVQAAYVIDGSAPPYELVPPHGSEYAVLGDVEVPDGQRLSNGGPSVFETTARLSAIALEDGSLQGGTEIDGTLGLNWNPDSNVKLMANYIRVHVLPAAQSVVCRRERGKQSLSWPITIYW